MAKPHHHPGVPFPPGGQADLAARPIAPVLEKVLGRPVVIDNRPGAGGAIGNAAVAKAEPDGHTLLVTLSAIVISPEAERLFGRQPLYELDQLVPVARVLSDPNVLAVPVSAPWTTLKEFVDDATRRPGAITYSSSGNYGAAHVSMELFAQRANIKLQHVPYRGVGPALTGLISNQVSALATAPGPVASHIEAGTVRILASWSGARIPKLPNVPTFRELGYPSVEYYVWAGMFAPKGVPEAVMTRLRAAMREAMNDPQVISIFDKASIVAAYLDGPEFARFIEADSARVIPAIRRIGRLE